jgi:hypothetical protein
MPKDYFKVYQVGQKKCKKNDPKGRFFKKAKII